MVKIKTSKPEVLWNAKCILGEGTLWVKEHKSKYNTEIKKKRNHKINIKNNKYQKDNTPLDPTCENLNLNKYSKNYLNHLFNTNEILASMLLTLHNINFYQELMSQIRKNINSGTFDDFHNKYIDKL